MRNKKWTGVVRLYADIKIDIPYVVGEEYEKTQERLKDAAFEAPPSYISEMGNEVRSLRRLYVEVGENGNGD